MYPPPYFEEILVAVVIRLARYGAPKKPFYRIIASEKGTKRDSKFIEVVGTLNPMTKPAVVSLKTERIQHWLANGAVPSQTVKDVIKKQIPGFIEGRETHQRSKILAARKARKARLAGAGKKASKKK
jgi:small subunit ribosomal protein S16